MPLSANGRILLRGMRRGVTTNGVQAYDAYNNTLEHPGALTSLTNTQRLSHHRLIYNAFAEVRPHTVTTQQHYLKRNLI